ncbi:MAG: helix-turn-helix transcriptional regulator [Candidatus Neomarinimicrobiota bacterium]
MNDKKKWTEGIGDRVKSVRWNARLDQLRFGESVGVTRQSISAYETERLMPSRNVVERMSDTYGISPSWLLYGVKSGQDHEMASTQVSGPDKADEPKLSNAQRILLEYILDNKKAAQHLAEELFNKALEL